MKRLRAVTLESTMPAHPRSKQSSRVALLLDKLDPGRPRIPLLIALLGVAAIAVVQATTLTAPINGEHNWRQADTYSVAYNFVHERASFFYPRIDWAGDHTGIMGMETPVYTYAVALLMRVLGDSPFAGRLVNWLLLMAAFVSVAFSFRLAPRDWARVPSPSRPNRSWLPVGIALFAALSPLVFFEGRQFQPDPAMASLTTIAASCFHLFGRRERVWLYVVGMLFYCLAVATKSPALVAGPALYLLTFTVSPRFRWYKPVLRGIPFLIPLAFFVVWDKWAHHLTEIYAGGSAYFATDLNWPDYVGRIHDTAVLKRVFWFVIPSYGANWVLFPVFAAGVPLGFRRGLRGVSLPMLLWLAMGTALCAGLERMHWHWYYAFMFMMPLVYFGGIGIAALFEAIAAYRETPRLVQWGFWFMTLALLATEWAGGPAKPLEQTIGASQPIANASWTTEDGFFGLFILQLVAMAMVTATPRRWAHWIGALALATATYVAMPRAARDLWQIFSWRSRVSEWPDWSTHWKELRKNVDELSTRNDRFVVDGGSPWFLYLVLRKGYTFYTGDLDNLGLSYFTDRGMRFYVHFPQNGPVSSIVKGRTPLRAEDRWAIYCIAATGCP